jgi:hypothetical protein
MCSMVEYRAKEFCKAYLEDDKLKMEAATRDLVSAVEEIKETKKDIQIREAARHAYSLEGFIEIDEDAIVSKTEEGAYVAAWVWISKEEFRRGKRK